MKPLLCLFIVLIFFAAGCASSVPMSDGTLVASEISVVNGRNPVLFVGRDPEDGEWIVLTDERAAREVVVYALFQDLLAFDSTLSQVRDLPVGWKATRPSRSAPWVRERFSLTQQMTMQPKAAAALEKSSRRKSTPLAQYSVTVFAQDVQPSNTRQISLDEKSLKVWRIEEEADARSSTLIWSDSITTATIHAVDSLVQLCGPDTLKDSYGTPTSSAQKKLVLIIWDVKKERSASTRITNCWVPPVYELCAYINSLLPKRYAMNLTLSKE